MVVKVSKPEINVREKISELDKPSGTAGQAMLAAETPQEQFNLIGAGRRRINLNGAMNVWQRGTSFTSVSSVAYHSDRHQTYISNTATGVATISKSTDAPSGFGSSYKLEVTTADTSLAVAAEYGLYHYFEGQDLQGMKKGTPDALPVTISFWVKSSLHGKFVVELMDNDNSNRHCNKPYYVNAANTWEYKTITFPPDTTGVLANDNGNSFHFNFWLGGGTNYSGSSLQENWGALNQSARADGQVNVYGTNGATWQVTGVQLEVGKVATPFEHRSYGEELALCQRYYEIIGNWSSTSQFYAFPIFKARSASLGIPVHFRVQKRATPSITSYDRLGTTTGVFTQISNGTNLAIQYGPSADVNGVYRTQHATQPVEVTTSAYGLKITVDAEL